MSFTGRIFVSEDAQKDARSGQIIWIVSLDSCWMFQSLNQKSVSLDFNTSFPLKIRTFLPFCLRDKRQRCNKSRCLAIKKSFFWVVWRVWNPPLKTLSVAEVHWYVYKFSCPSLFPSIPLSPSLPLWVSPLSVCFVSSRLHQGTYDLWAHLSATIKQSLMKPRKVTFVCTVHSMQYAVCMYVCVCACLKRASLHVYTLWQRLRGRALTSRMVSKSMMSS